MKDFPNQTGWFYEGWGEDSLVGFLLRLHQVAHAGLKLQEDVLPRYLIPPPEARFQVVDLAFKYGIYKKLTDHPEVRAAEVQQLLRTMVQISKSD